MIKLPDSISPKESRTIISSGGVVFRTALDDANNWEFLLLRHKRGHHWDFPKGRREKGENDLQTAKREIFEETGIGPQKLKILKRLKKTVRYTVRRGSLLLPKEVRLFLIKVGNVANEDTILSNEHTSFAWLSYGEALKRITYNSSRKILMEAQSWIENNLTLIEPAFFRR